jgi:soluble lytic murein transglycosylase
MLATWLVLVVAHAGAMAQPPAADPATAAGRRLFLEAEQALRAGKLTRYRRLRQDLEDYPLARYLDHAELGQRLAGARPDEIARFLAVTADGPLAERLRSAWLETLARQGRWKAFLDFYQARKGAALRCHRLTALLRTGRRGEALAEVPELWLTASSQPRACDPPFDVWIGDGGPSAELAWTRTGLAMRAGQVGLARYLERFLDRREAVLARLWRALRARPQRVGEVLGIDANPARLEEVLEYGLTRLARKDPAQAVSRWEVLEGDFSFSADARARVQRAIGLAFARRHAPEAIEWLARVPDELADRRVREWRISAALRQGRWARALEFIERLESTAREEARWRYWAGRALEIQGHAGEAHTLFAAAAAERGFFGFLSADRIGQPYHYGDQPLEVSPEALDRVAAIPAVRRAGELLALGRRLDARREWHHAIVDLDAGELVVAAKLAERWGWHGRAILTIALTPHRDDLGLRFPIVYRDEVDRAATSGGPDSAWLYAVVRQESAFVSDARSRKGALGLMQIMPATGRHIARRLGTKLPSRRTLLEPVTSVRYGAAYLGDLAARFDGHRALASAAYNAGPSRVRSWLPREDVVEADVWIENVPFAETRRYVQRVLAYTAIYEHRLGLKVVPLSTRLRAIGPPAAES